MKYADQTKAHLQDGPGLQRREKGRHDGRCLGIEQVINLQRVFGYRHNHVRLHGLFEASKYLDSRDEQVTSRSEHWFVIHAKCVVVLREQGR